MSDPPRAIAAVQKSVQFSWADRLLPTGCLKPDGTERRQNACSVWQVTVGW